MSPQQKSLRIRAAIIGVCIEAATWLLPFWAMRISPANPEDTLPMWLFGVTQFPSILLLFLVMLFARFIEIPGHIVIGYVATSITQAFLIAVYAYLLLYRSQKR